MTKSPRRLKEQVRDSVGEQVRDIPLHAVRLAMFGVGRALLLSDRVTKDYKEITEGAGVKPVIGRFRDDVQHTAGKVVGHVVERVRGGEPEPEPEPERASTRTRAVATAPAKPSPAAKPGPAAAKAAPKAGEEISVGKPKPPAEAKPAPKPQAEAKPAPKPQPKPAAEPAKPAEPAAEEAPFEPKPEVKPAAPAEAEKVAAELPVPNYDAATLPQLRARLRGLSSDQVKLLREYERKHAAREDVLRMYENRIAKLNGLS
ncbi:hypothetical protein ACH34Q_13940 [Actinomadura sp. 9N407]